MEDLPKPKNMEEATILVSPYITMYNQYKVVSVEDAALLLGEDKLAQLQKDPIRKHCPKPDSFYYWNVCTYLII